MNCDHKNFVALVSVGRLTDGEGNVTNYSADVRIKCADCERPFEFLGLQAGVNPWGATVSVDGLEARLAICPDNSGKSALAAMAAAFKPARPN